MIRTPASSHILVKLFLALALALTAFAASVSAANATVFCVDRADAECTSNQATPQAALTAAATTAGTDRVLLGTGTYSSANGLSYNNAQADGTVEIEGAGIGQTFLTIDDFTGSKSIFSIVANADSMVSNLSITGIASPDTNGDFGLSMAGSGTETGPTASDVQVSAPLGFNFTGVRLQNATLDDSTVTLPFTGGNMAVRQNNQNATISDSELTAPTGLVSSGSGKTSTVKNSTIHASNKGVTLDSGNVEVIDSLITLDNASGGSGIYLANDNASNSSIHGFVSGSTIVGGNATNSNGIVVTADNGQEQTSLELDNTVISGPFRPLRLTAGNGRTASASVRYSSYDQAKVVQNAVVGGVAGTIDYTVGEGFLALPTDPGFIDPSTGDFHIDADSPFVDVGDPADPVAGSTDFEGDPRACHGTALGLIRRDIGADERRAPSTDDCMAPETSIQSGPGAETEDATPEFNFVSSKPGSTFICSIDDGSESACGAIWSPVVALTPGSHTVTVKAVDGFGNVDQSGVTSSFKVVSPTGPTGNTGPSGDTTPPQVLKLKAPKKTKANRVKVTFKSNEADVIFTCRLNKGKATRCKSPWKTPKLKKGKNKVQVWATDAAGNRSGTKSVTVKRK